MHPYLTFTSVHGVWRLHEGIGASGRVLAERSGVPGIADLSAADDGLLWVLLYEQPGSVDAIARLRIPELEIESVAWPGGRLGAVASSPSGERSAVLELPDGFDAEPALHVFEDPGWRRVSLAVAPDISSGLAWLDDSRIAYESNARALVLVDLATGSEQRGPEGRFPVAARQAKEWFAIGGERVLRFPLERPFSIAATPLEGFGFRRPSSIRTSGDARVFVWTEPRFGKRSVAFVQERNRRKQRFREVDQGLGAVLGPGSSSANDARAGSSPR